MIDEKHRIEFEKNKTGNRHKRLQEGVPLCYPLAINIELSNDCNSECYMCPRKDLSRSIGKMEFSLFKKVIDELAHNGILLRKLFLYWMGEPLLNENFDKMIAYAKEKNIAEIIVMGSNIIALDKEKAERLIKAELDEIFVSLDAIRPETYTKIKGHDKHLSLIESNLVQLVEMKKKMGATLPYIRLKFLKNELNKDDVEDFKNKWGSIVEEVYIEEDLNAWNGANDKVNKEIIKDKYYKDLIKDKIKRWPCNRLWYQVAISHDGFVSPCSADWDGAGFLGNIKEKSLFELWNSAQMVEMRRKHLDARYSELRMCKDCNRWIFRHMEDWFLKNSEKALAVCWK